MKKYTVLAVVAGAVALFGVSAVTSYSVAEPRGSWGGHDGGPGSHGMRHHRMGGHHGMKRHGMRGHGRRHGSGMGGGMGMTYLMERFDSDKDGKLTPASPRPANPAIRTSARRKNNACLGKVYAVFRSEYAKNKGRQTCVCHPGNFEC